MIHYFEKQQDKLIRLPSLQAGCWINIVPPFNLVELEKIAEELQIPMDFLTDSLDIDERARFEIEDDIKLIVLNTPLLNESFTQEPTMYITVPIGIILTPQHLITITSYDNMALRGFIEGKVRHFQTQNKQLFVLQLLEQNVLEFLRCLKDINVRRNIIEQEVYESSRNQDLMRLLNLEKSLVYFLAALSSNAIMLVKMRRIDLLGIKNDEDKYDLLEGIIIDNHQAQEMASIYSKIIGETMEALSSMINNNLNIVIQRLTLITLILMLPTVIASFYGMNVPIPQQDSPYVFYILVSVVVTLTIILIWFFRRKRMF